MEERERGEGRQGQGWGWAWREGRDRKGKGAASFPHSRRRPAQPAQGMSSFPALGCPAWVGRVFPALRVYE